MFGLRNLFASSLCCTRAPLLKTILGNQMRLSYFPELNSRKHLLPISARQLMFSPVGNVKHFSAYPGNKFYRYVKKVIRNLKIVNRKKDLELGMYLYQSLEHVSFQEFYTHLSLPDTYRSWFIVSELHVWMMLVRLQQEGIEGRYIRDAVIESFYDDSGQRAKILAPMDGTRRQGQLAEMYEDFKSALMFYDEGIITEDRVLANALWFHFFAKQCDDPRLIEILIRYIRHQINFLCHLNSQDIKNYNRSSIIWQPLEPHVRAVKSL